MVLKLAFSLAMAVQVVPVLRARQASWKAGQQEIHRAGRSLGSDGFFSLRRRDLSANGRNGLWAAVLRPPPRLAPAHTTSAGPLVFGLIFGLFRVFNKNIHQWLAGTNLEDPQDTERQRGRPRTSALADISVPWHFSPNSPTSIAGFDFDCASDACAFHSLRLARREVQIATPAGN